MSFKEFLPTSFEMFFTPLVIAYVVFAATFPYMTWKVLIIPGIWFAIISLFALLDYPGNKNHWLLIKRILLILGCLLPMAIFWYWAWITGRLDKV